MPFRLAFLRRRKGLVAGAVLAFLLIQVLSLHVWSVEVSGNEGIPTEQIESVAAELGLKPGVWKKDVQAKLLQQQLMNAFPQASWLSVNTSGCLVQIELEELSENRTWTPTSAPVISWQRQPGRSFTWRSMPAHRR